MNISRTTKSAFIFAFNCWGLFVWLVWQFTPEATPPPPTDGPPYFTVMECNCGSLAVSLLDLSNQLLAIALVLALGSTLAFIALARKDHSSEITLLAIDTE